MSTPHGCNDDSDVIELFKEALKQRVGHERFQIWFSGIRFEFDPASCDNDDAHRAIIAIAHGQFAADRLTKNYLSAMRGAAASAVGKSTLIRVQVEDRPAQQVELPFADSKRGNPGNGVDQNGVDQNGVDQSGVDQTKRLGSDPPSHHDSSKSVALATSRRQRPRNAHSTTGRPGGTQSLNSILRDGRDSRKPAVTRQSPERSAAPLFDLDAPPPAATKSGAANQSSENRPAPAAAGSTTKTRASRSDCNWENFIAGQSNQLARTACKMAIENPGMASPLVLWGPPGSGKTHLLCAVAQKLRGLHRMRRVVYLSAEEFTNDFIKALNGNCLPAFRSRFRDADALLIDDIQFFVEKKATIRELHHTIEMLAESGKPLVFAGTKAPTEINGLGGELSGRLASGLVCQVDSLDDQTRTQLLSRYSTDRCLIPWPTETLDEIAGLADGDGRLLSGIVNLVALLQRMYGQMPSMDQIRQHGGHLLRRAGVPITLSAIERAVERVFQLDSHSLQSGSQTKSVTEPRMLAMYLSREMTSSAFSEIGGHFGGRSHSTAILANQRVRQWLDAGRSIGRGKAAMSTDEAIRRIESMLKTG